MKFIVTLTKATEKTVIVEANDLVEADRKLTEGDVIASFERTVSSDVYGGWDYQEDIVDGVDQNCIPVDEDDAVIFNLEDFAKWYECETVSGLERALFNNTDCGMCYSVVDGGIKLCGYVEGADCEHPNETLRYPFTGSSVKAVIARLEEEADEMWHEWNDEEDLL